MDKNPQTAVVSHEIRLEHTAVTVGGYIIASNYDNLRIWQDLVKRWNVAIRTDRTNKTVL